MTASSVTFTQRSIVAVRDVVADVTFSSVDGSFVATDLPSFGGRLAVLRTNPGSTAPTDNYDITLIDADGIDRLQGVGMNRDTANSEEALIVYSGTAIHPPCVYGETLTLTITGNSVNSATTTIRFVYLPH